MRWTLGLLCVATACFGEETQPSNTSADETTESPTTSVTMTDASTSSASASGSSSTSNETDTSGPPDMTESSGVDTTAGDVCPMGSVPNPPPPPPGWSLVFVSSPSAEPPGCPPMSERIAVGSFGIPGGIDECECRCDAPFHELCNLTYTHGAACPANGGDQQIDADCEGLPADQMGFLGDGLGSTCDPQPVPPMGELVSVCASAAADGPCIDQPDGLIGPCLFREGTPPMDGCPDGLERVDVGRIPVCGGCAADCPIAAHCNSAEFQVWSEADCTESLVAFTDDACHETLVPAGSISARPTVPQGCADTTLTYTELTVCCPM